MQGTGTGKIVLRALVFAVFCLASLGGCRFTGPSAEERERYEYLKNNIESAVCQNEGRMEAARDVLLDATGKAEVEEFSMASNVVSFKPGNNDENIVIGAHYDKTADGCGAIDNWTGVVILSLLAKELRNQDSQKSYTFVAFGGEERDLQGSKAMAEAISKENGLKPCAMINLDSFGFEKTWALRSISDPSMLSLAADVERGRGGSFSIRSYRGASSDSQSFRRIGVPSITFSGLGDDWRDYIHSEDDVVANIDMDVVAENFAFLREFVLHLDSVSCGSLRGRDE